MKIIKKIELFKILDFFALKKNFHQRLNSIKICKILLDNKDFYYEKILELFFIIATYEKILDVIIALSKLIKKVLLNDKSPCYGELSLYKLCKILLNKKKNRSIENILNDIIIKEIDDKNDSIYNNFCLKFKNKYKEKVFIETNNYFIKEFNIDYEEEKSKKSALDEFSEEKGKKEQFEKVQNQNKNFEQNSNNINNENNINNINDNIENDI